MTRIPYGTVTDEATKFMINEARHYGRNDDEFVNGYSRIKGVKLTVKRKGIVETIWHFDTVKEEKTEKIGYIVESWRNYFECQTTKEDGNKAFMMIMEKAKRTKDIEVIVEKWGY